MKSWGGQKETEVNAGPGGSLAGQPPGPRGCAGLRALRGPMLPSRGCAKPAPGAAAPFSPLAELAAGTGTRLPLDVNPKGKYERPVKADLGHVVPVLGWQQGL